MARIRREQLGSLTAAIRTHDFLRRAAGEIERLHRVVFHDNQRADWSLAGRSAEQILAAEIVSRHRGQIDGIYFALRKMETTGKSWDEAVRDLAAALHSYYTTPLGIVMRQDLFGQDAVFITPDAYDSTDQIAGTPERSQSETP